MTLEELIAKYYRDWDGWSVGPLHVHAPVLAKRLLRIRELLVVDGMVMAPKNTAEAREILELLEREV